MELSQKLIDLLFFARERKKRPLAKLISIFESHHPDDLKDRIAIIHTLQSQFPHESCPIIGFTGTPGVGKSSLIGKLCLTLIDCFPHLSVAVLAVDPSSHRSGGSILGDRTRVHFPPQDLRFFFRSQASNLELGGVSQKTFQATRLLKHFFDLIFIETVGIGQSEIEVQHISDHTCLVMQPLAGDDIQFMKAGIMEVPDTFIINKCDEAKLAKKSYYLLQTNLKTTRLLDGLLSRRPPKVFLTSATQQLGIKDLALFLGELRNEGILQEDVKKKELFYLKKWVQTEFGLWGLRHYDIWQEQNQDRIAAWIFEEHLHAFQQVLNQRIKTL